MAHCSPKFALTEKGDCCPRFAHTLIPLWPIPCPYPSYRLSPQLSPALPSSLPFSPFPLLFLLSHHHHFFSTVLPTGHCGSNEPWPEAMTLLYPPYNQNKMAASDRSSDFFSLSLTSSMCPNPRWSVSFFMHQLCVFSCILTLRPKRSLHVRGLSGVHFSYITQNVVIWNIE